MGGFWSRPQQETKASTTAFSVIDNVPSNYHTVTICGTLPSVRKDYNEYEKRQDLPDVDYWVAKVDMKAHPTRYKVQHIIANGPRE
jgi:hypothetical protein